MQRNETRWVLWVRFISILPPSTAGADQIIRVGIPWGIMKVLAEVGPVQHGKIASQQKNWVVATQIFFIFTPKIGEDEPILTSIFFKWVETTN